MRLILQLFVLATLSTNVGFCETKVDNNTVISRREILEQQARTAYQNACYRLQELSNWMTAVFRIKSVWATATVNEIASRSEGSLTESDRRNKAGLPSRSKTTSTECSFSSVQVTAQTYAYLQSQLVMMKWLLGRNLFKSSKERLGEVKERMKMLDAFNNTLNDVVSKLKQSTKNASTPADSESWTGRIIMKNAQEGRFFQLLQSPKIILMNILDDQVLNNQARDQTEPRKFFQNLGRNLDKLIFPVVPMEINTDIEQSVVKTEQSIASTEQSITGTEQSITGTEQSIASTEQSVTSTEQPVVRAEHSAAKISTSGTVMFSSIF